MADPTVIQDVNGTSTTASTSASFAAATAGHLLVLATVADDYVTTPPSGWTQLAAEQQTFHGLNCWFKYATGGETSVTYVIGSATRSSWKLVEFDNVSASGFDGGAGTFVQASDYVITTPTLTPTAGRRLILAIAGFSASTASVAFPNPTWGTVTLTDGGSSAGPLANPQEQVSAGWTVADYTGSNTVASTATLSSGDTPQARSAIIGAFVVGSGGGPTGIAFDAQTVGTAYTSTGTQTTSHPGSASARAAVVLIDQNGTTTDEVSGVTYGGTAMTRLRSDTEATEAGRVYLYWLDNVATGTQNVAMTTTGATNKQLVVATMTADTGYAVAVAGHNAGTSASVANPSWTITGLTAATDLEAFEVIHSGLTTMTATPAASWTLISSTDLGAQGRGFARQSIASSGTSLTSGWTAATADDFVGASVAFYQVASGTSYTGSPADAVGLTDAETIALDALRGQPDPVSVTDATLNTLAAARAQADPVGLTDTATATLNLAYTATPSDPVGASDSTAAAVDRPRAVSDLTGITDSLLVETSNDDATTDPVGLTDSASAVISTGGTGYVSSPTDPTGIADVAVDTLASVRAVADPIGLTDASAGILGVSRSQGDPAGIADVTAVTAVTARALADATGITDAISIDLIAAGSILQADAIGATDTATRTAAGTRNLGDPTGITDATAITTASIRTPADPVGLTDAVVAQLDRVITVADLLGLIDGTSTSTTTSNARTPGDPEPISDAISYTMDRPRPIPDPISLSDSCIAVLDRVASVADILGMVDLVAVAGAPVDITVTATIDPRRWAGALDPERWTGTLNPRRWEAS